MAGQTNKKAGAAPALGWDWVRRSSLWFVAKLAPQDLAHRGLGQVVAELGEDAGAPAASPAKIACVPAGEMCDEVACGMLSALLRERGYEAEVFSSGLTSGEMAGRVAAVEPEVICVCSAIPQTVNMFSSPSNQGQEHLPRESSRFRKSRRHRSDEVASRSRIRRERKFGHF